ncbi:hypothetical protein TorRG33x02_167570 [Trema orientale]|uniref:Uncharacterized protein n=1 Tax=Trema orientale TaxID=63057 RepID=A0A2P5EPE0_TREOI|nr:hypothetical protein TorRG33x02_167570 [Trema orientale]
MEERNCNKKKVIKNKFLPGQQVFLLRSRLNLFKSKWSGPFFVVKVFPCQTVDIKGKDGHTFRVYNHRLKLMMIKKTDRRKNSFLESYPRA